MDRILSTARVDIVLLDIMLPGEDGLSICRRLRNSSTIPIIILSARGEEIDRVVGLEIGADDYLAKPFSARELLARIRAILRRSTNAVTKPVRVDSRLSDLRRLDHQHARPQPDDAVGCQGDADRRRVRSPRCLCRAGRHHADTRPVARTDAGPAGHALRTLDRHSGQPPEAQALDRR